MKRYRIVLGMVMVLQTVLLYCTWASFSESTVDVLNGHASVHIDDQANAAASEEDKSQELAASRREPEVPAAEASPPLEAAKVLPPLEVVPDTGQPAEDAAEVGDSDFKRGPQNARQQKIVDMMRHAWNEGYAKHCWGSDELYPVSQTCGSGWRMGLTLVDALDTLYLMGMDDEFEAAKNWVADKGKLNFQSVGNVNLFETTIRILGGLLGAYSISGEEVFLDRAKELGDRLLPGLGGYGKGVPYSDINVRTGRGSFLGGDASSAEATTLGLEFRTLSALTGISKYAEAVDRVSQTFHAIEKESGLIKIRVDPHNARFDGNTISLGSRGDSYYEYLLKEWLLSGKQEEVFLQDYEEAMRGVQERLIQTSDGPLHLTFVAELQGGSISKKMDHLVCFLPGLLALGAHFGVDEGHLQLAKLLVRTCFEMYNASGRMLGPEIAHFDQHGKELYIKPADSHDILRPETVESLFYLFRLTGDEVYQEWGWKIASAIEQHAKVPGGGYSSLSSVLQDPPPRRDKMESFFLAETLKYLFLLFDDSKTQVSLDHFVFNTEAHPLRMNPERVWNSVATGIQV